MESPNTIELVTAIGFAATAGGLIVLAAYLGYLGGKWMGALVLSIEAILASVICMAGAWGGYTLEGTRGAWIGLSGGMLLAAILVALIFSWITGVSRSGRFAAGVWLGFCAVCLAGYLSGGWLGLLTITLPAIILFWWGLFRLSAYILPLRDRSQQGEAFSCLLTFSMGTNYPYYFVNGDNKLEKRIEGNQFLQFFAGPGVLYLDCEHAAYVSNGVSENREFEPGLNFTRLYDLEPRIIDLKPQLRAFPVDALTKDGIPVRVTTFIPFKVSSGLRKAGQGRSFPFRSGAIFDTLRSEVTERKGNKQDKENGQKYPWDGGPNDGLIPLLGTRVMQDIISRYTVDELCAQRGPEADLQARLPVRASPVPLASFRSPPGPKGDPRLKIAEEMRNQVRAALLPMGLELVGGGISNLEPQDEAIIERRLDSWRTRWEREILRLMSQGQARAAESIQAARAEAEATIVARLNRVIQESEKTGGISGAALALRFIDTLGEIVSESNQWPLPAGIEETWKRLRGELEHGQRPVDS